MNTYVNYLLEANLGLCLFLLVYYLLLRNETNFTFKRNECKSRIDRQSVLKCDIKKSLSLKPHRL